MDFVYICREGDNEELRYSIRSVLKNCKTVNNIWVVGGKPDWYSGNFVGVRAKGNTYTNARNNLNAIVNNPDISDSFVLMNDDFFIMKPTDEILYYYSGTLEDKINYRKQVANHSLYTVLLARTHGELNRGYTEVPLDYELHIPMVFEKEKLSNILSSQGLWRSMYGNTYGVGGKQMNDVKVYANNRGLAAKSFDINSSQFLSTEDSVFEEYVSMFQEMFPEPSIFEYPR